MFRTVPPLRSFFRSSGQILLPWYLMNYLSNLDETYKKYSSALLMTWLDSGVHRSKVKVTAGRQLGEGIHVDSGRRCPVGWVAQRKNVGLWPASFLCPTLDLHWRVTTYVDKPSAKGQSIRPTQSFILPRSINWVVSYIVCVLSRSNDASGECLRSKVRMVVWVAGKNCVIPLTRAIL